MWQSRECSSTFCESTFPELRLNSMFGIHGHHWMMHFNYFMIMQARRDKAWHWHPFWSMSQYRHGDISVVGSDGCYCYGSSFMQTELQQFPVKKDSVDSITIVEALFTWTFHILFFLACPPVLLCLKRWIWNQTDTAVHTEDKCIFLIMWMRVNTFQ